MSKEATARSAMKLALEALQDARQAIIALREALAEQPARPYRQLQDNGSKYFGESWDKAEQPAQQEPVLQDIEQYRLQMAGISTAAIGYWKEGDGIHPDYDTVALRDVAKLYAKYDELYRAQRPWVNATTWRGLTDEEAFQICVDCGCLSEDWLTLLDAIEAKLKEKNT